MNPDLGTELRSGRIIRSSLETPVPTDPDMAQSSANDSDSNETSDISSQLSEIKESYERKINELQNEFSQLKDLMMAVISKTDTENRQSTSKGPSKPTHTVGLDMVTGATETRSNRPTTSFTNFRNYQEDDSDEGESTPRSNEERLLNAIETIPQRIKNTTTNTKLLQTHVPNFRGQKDKFVEFEHLLLNHLSPLANKITEENKLHFFQSLLRDDAIEYWQSIQITPMTTLKDVLDLFRKEFAKEDLKEVARYKWDQARYDPTTETFGDFLKNLKKTAKQAFGNEADRIIKMFLFGKLPVEIQQELTMANKEESSPEEIKTYLMRKYQYQQYVAPPTAIQLFNAVTSSAPPTITTTKPTTTTTTAQPTERKRFEGQCFYCGKTGHRKTECRARQRDEANGIKKEDAIPMKKAADPDKPKYNPKLVCQICGYTGHSARDCRRCVPKESSSAYGKIPYATNSQDDNRTRRQDLKRQQKPMNPMQAVAEEEDQESYSDEDINQGF